MNNEKKMHEPLFHIAKRPSIVWWKAWIIRTFAIVIALMICSVVIVFLTKLNPLDVYSAMIKGSFGSERKIWILLQNIAMLLCISLAVTPAFRMKFWNLGAEGQVLIGGLSSMVFMFYLGDKLEKPLPNYILLPIMLAASILGGIIWGLIPAFFKAKWNTNETLFTLMMNYIAIQLVSFAIMVWVPSGSSVMGLINGISKSGWLPDIFGQKYLVNILIVAILTFVIYIYMNYSKHGYEIAVVGESENTAKYIGINVKKVIIRTMILSGALCGLAGFLLVSGTNHTISKELAGGNGFTAVMVSWLAKFNPIVMIITSFLIVFLQRGSGEIATTFNLDESVSDILTGIIIFFIIGCEFFINYQIKRSHKEA
ncbi:MAG: ABC transporter permease [Clostridiales bacterium]|nr:ABC transporter permease [Clostridiales bacterium]